MLTRQKIHNNNTHSYIRIFGKTLFTNLLSFISSGQRVVVVSFLVIVAGFQLFTALRPIPHLLEHVVNDDTFYYLEVAWRASRGQGYTFDSINPTNGFQPLWGSILTGLAWLSPNKDFLLHATLILSTLLNLLAGIGIYRIANMLLPPTFSFFPVALWLSIQLTPGISLSGLETSLNWLVFVALLGYILKLANHPSIRWSDGVIAGGLCGLLFLARVDNVIYWLVTGIIVGLLLPKSWSKRMSVSLALGVTSLLIVLPYLSWNVISFGELLPISGVIKRHINFLEVIVPRGGYESVDLLFYVFSRAISKLHWVFAHTLVVPGFGQVLWLTTPVRILMFSGMVMLAYGLGSKFSRRHHTSYYYALSLVVIFWIGYGLLDLIAPEAWKAGAKAVFVGASVLVASFIGIKHDPGTISHRVSKQKLILLLFISSVVVHLIILIYFADYFLDYTSWYFANWFIVILFGVASAIVTVLPKQLHKLFAIWMIAGVIATTYGAVANVQQPPRTPPYGTNGPYEVANWLRQNTHEESVVAAYNAGVLGYFSGRSVINLDGLINNHEIIPYRFGPYTMTEYLDINGVDYFVDYQSNKTIDQIIALEQVMGIDSNRLSLCGWMSAQGFPAIPRTFFVFRFLRSPAEPCEVVEI
jgi:hypothetical protein